MKELLQIMAQLRDPENGCPWDLKQTFETIAPYTIEEAYEVAEAIDSGDLNALKKELGDLLFQVVFYARMAEEQGAFNFDDVAAAISTKLTERHPHVFAGADYKDEAELKSAWEAAKLAEREADGHTNTSVLDGVPTALPALKRASKQGKRAASVGFDWPDRQGVEAKVAEELRELADALEQGDQVDQVNQAAVDEEFGDLLLAMTSYGRHIGVDPEESLRLATNKFGQRFRRMEALMADAGVTWESQSAAQLDGFWEQAKLAE